MAHAAFQHALLCATLLLLASGAAAVRVPSALLDALWWLPQWLRPPPPQPRAKPWLPGEYPSELRTPAGHVRAELVRSALPHTYLGETLPDAFNWADVGGVNYLTLQLNQHVPYCACARARAAARAATLEVPP